MARKSSIESLPPDIQVAVNAALRQGWTIDDIVGHVRDMGGDVSRSAVGRYKQRFEQIGRKMRETRDVAKVWIDKLGEEPDGDVARLLTELIRTIAFKTSMTLAEDDDAVDPKHLAMLARSIKDLATADRATAELALKLRREIADEAAEAVETVAKERGLSADAVDEIKRKILGVRDAGAAVA